MSQPQPKLADLRIERKAAPDSPHRAGLWVTLGLVIAALAAAAWWFARPQPLLVTTALAREVATSGGDRTVLNASGYVTARREATVSSKVTGKVTEVHIEEGVAVKQGQLLAKLDDTNAQASVQLARAQLASAGAGLEETRVRLKEAELELQRQTILRKNQVAALADYDRAEAAAQAWRARHVGFVFQLYNLIPVLTAERNVELPLLLTHLSKAERKRHVATALAIVGLAHRANHYPRTLSGGEQQRVGIARGIVTDPTLLLCDEPTGDLDRKSGDEILNLLQALNREQGKTIVMVTHDPHASARASRTVYLDKGQLSNAPVK